MQHDFTLAPNGTQTIDVAGRFFKYKSGAGLIRIRATKGGYIDLLPGQGVENEPFTSLTVQDRSGVANAGTLLAGDFSFRDDRISGSVEVIDGGRTRTLAGVAFLGGNNQAGVPGVPSVVQLWNPPGSGVNVIVKEISFSGDIAGIHSIKVGSTRAQAVSGVVPSKKVGGPASKAQQCIQNGDLATDSYLYNVVCQANQGYTKVFQEPLILVPGKGVFVSSFGNGESIFANFEFVEEPF